MDTILRVHWLGKKKISADTNSEGLMAVWKMPESVSLEAQTLDKLSLAPWRLLRGQTNLAVTNLLRPLLQDLIDGESYVEVRRPANPTNAPEEMILAVRLDNSRSGLWQTNVAAALESLTGIKPVSTDQGWFLKKHHAPNLIEFARAGEWTVLGAAENQNRLFTQILARIQSDHHPFDAAPTNCWLQVDADLPRVAGIFGHSANLAATFPRISFALAGDGKDVHTQGDLNFPEPVAVELKPWNIPTNLIGADLLSFSALRGWTPGLISRLWKEAVISNPPPCEFYAWSLNGFPMQTYFAAPVVDASNAVSKLSDFIMQESMTHFATNDLVRFERAKTFNGLQWKGAPFVSPFLKSVEGAKGGFVFGGFFPHATTGQSPPRFLRDLPNRTNLLYFDWEVTGPRIEQLIYLSQFIRFVQGKPQLPARSASLAFLLRMTKTLGPSRTEIVAAGPQRFHFERSSGIPFPALELQILAYWMESPQFPELDINRGAYH